MWKIFDLLKYKYKNVGRNRVGTGRDLSLHCIYVVRTGRDLSLHCIYVMRTGHDLSLLCNCFYNTTKPCSRGFKFSINISSSSSPHLAFFLFL